MPTTDQTDDPHPRSGPVWDRRDAIALALLAVVVAIPLRGLMRDHATPDGRGLHARLPRTGAARPRPQPRLPPPLRPGKPLGARRGYKVFGVALATERIFGLVQHLGIILGVYWLCRRWGRAAALVGASTALFINLSTTGLMALAWNGAVAWGVWGVWALLKARETDETRWKVIAGLLLSMCLLYRPDLILAVGLGLVGALWGADWRRLRPLAAGFGLMVARLRRPDGARRSRARLHRHGHRPGLHPPGGSHAAHAAALERAGGLLPTCRAAAHRGVAVPSDGDPPPALLLVLPHAARAVVRHRRRALGLAPRPGPAPHPGPAHHRALRGRHVHPSAAACRPDPSLLGQRRQLGDGPGGDRRVARPANATARVAAVACAGHHGTGVVRVPVRHRPAVHRAWLRRRVDADLRPQRLRLPDQPWKSQLLPAQPEHPGRGAAAHRPARLGAPKAGPGALRRPHRPALHPLHRRVLLLPVPRAAAVHLLHRDGPVRLQARHPTRLGRERRRLGDPHQRLERLDRAEQVDPRRVQPAERDHRARLLRVGSWGIIPDNSGNALPMYQLLHRCKPRKALRDRVHRRDRPTPVGKPTDPRRLPPRLPDRTSPGSKACAAGRGPGSWCSPTPPTSRATPGAVGSLSPDALATPAWRSSSCSPASSSIGRSSSPTSTATSRFPRWPSGGVASSGSCPATGWRSRRSGRCTATSRSGSRWATSSARAGGATTCWPRSTTRTTARAASPSRGRSPPRSPSTP